jgi:hypothetical protein
VVLREGLRGCTADACQPCISQKGVGKKSARPAISGITCGVCAYDLAVPYYMALGGQTRHAHIPVVVSKRGDIEGDVGRAA